LKISVMAIMRWDPFRELDRFFDEDWGLVPMIRGGLRMAAPRIDVYQNENEVVAEVEVPAGIDPEKVHVSVEGDVLTVKGAVDESHEERNKNYYRREIRKGSFERSVMLPTTVKADRAEAVAEKGILKIILPKSEEAKAKTVEVKVKK